MSKLVDVNTSVVSTGGDRLIKYEQEIPEEFLTSLRKERDDSLSTPAGEFHRVASIPVAVVEKWLRQGFNVYEAPIQDTMARLRLEGLDGFLTTKKRI